MSAAPVVSEQMRLSEVLQLDPSWTMSDKEMDRTTVPVGLKFTSLNDAQCHTLVHTYADTQNI